MRNITLSIITCAFLAASFSVNSADKTLSRRVIFTCSGKQAVGYRDGSLSPSVFSDIKQFRIVEVKYSPKQIYWDVSVMEDGTDDEWESVGSMEYKGQGWVDTNQSGRVMGHSFIMNTRNLKFSFVDATQYLNDVKGDPYMTIGKCRKS